MTVRVGIIGVGIMGSDHARIFAAHVPGASVTAIYDADAARARAIAEETGAAGIAATPEALISDPKVDAVLIASPDATHAPLTIAAIAAGKPVLCEKPLAPSSRDCLDVVAAEVKGGKQLVQVGFMRRFDPSYLAMKAKWKSGALGKPLMFHCVHRNVSAPEWFTSDMAIANSAPHEFDVTRFVLDSDMTAITVFQPDAASKGGLVKPVFMVLRSAAGQLVNVEIHINAGYGYDVKGELVCERGSVLLRSPVHSEVNVALANATAIPEDWRPRFADAYRLQTQAWIRSVAKGGIAPGAANAWDGYAATFIAEAGLKSLAEGRTAEIKLAEMPAFYKQ